MGDVTAVMMDVITEKSGHQVVPMAVSVCTTPAAPSPLPIPYPVLGNSSEGIVDPPMRTKINGAPIATVGSAIKSCHGNEPGTLKEVVSLNTTGPCFLIMGAPVVLVELGMMGITGSPCISNKAITVGAPANASGAGGTGGAGGGGGGDGGAGGSASGSQGPQGGGGSGGGGSNTGAGGPGGSSGAPEEHQCVGGHPVDLVTGYVVDGATDIALPGAIPFVFRRTYSSGRRADRAATLGPGWAHGFEQRITEDDEVITLREAEGRKVWFGKIAPGESTFHRRERMTLHRDGEGAFRVERLADRLTYVFGAARPGGPALLRAVRDAWDNAISLEYEGDRLVRATDTAGRTVRVRWKDGRIARVEVIADGALALWYDYAYSAAGYLVSATDALGNADTYEYDRHGRMTATAIKTGVRFQYEYEADTGKCKRTWGPKGLYAIALRFDAAAKTTYVDGEEPRVITWNDLGVPTRIATPDGAVIEESAWDEDGLLVARVNGAGEGSQRWYDARGNLVRTVDALGNVTTIEVEDDRPRRRITAEGLVTETTYGARGEVVSVRFPAGDFYTLTYDARGRVTAVHGVTGQLTTFEHDAQHNVVAETDARGARTTFAYDALGRPTARRDALGRVLSTTYDRLGRPIQLRYPDGTSRQWAYDARGDVIRAVDALGQVTTFEYAGMGAITKITQPDGRVWTLSHTSEERLREVKNPRGEVYAFDHDEAGRIVAERTFDGRTIGYHYGPSGRVIRIDQPDGTARAFTYDRKGGMLTDRSAHSAVAYRRDRVGRIVAATVEEAGRRIDTVFERDRVGRVVAEIQGDHRLQFAFDAAGRRVSRALPGGATTRYTYDAAHALSAIDHAGVHLAMERDAVGREVSRGAGAIAVHHGYDVMDRLIEQRATAPSPGGGAPQALVQRQWRYDALGRASRIEDARWGATEYRYDRVGQLIAAKRGAYHEVFSYDPAGAIEIALGALSPRGSDEGFEIAAGNRLSRTRSAKYTYDARGRRTVKLDLTARGDDGEARATTYVWNDRDRIQEVRLPGGGQVRCWYDAFGRRVRKEIEPAGGGAARAVEMIWDGDVLAAEIDAERGRRVFVHEPGTFTPLLQEERGEVFLYVNDHLGAPRELIDPAGRVAWSAAMSAWGAVVETFADEAGERARGRAVSSPFRMPGQIADEETGLCFTRFRAFDPEIGRWCSPDPLGFAGGRDLYGFDGAPTVDTDPLGLAKHLPPDATINRGMKEKDGKLQDSPPEGAPNRNQKGARTPQSNKDNPDVQVKGPDDIVGPSTTGQSGLSGSTVPAAGPGQVNGTVKVKDLPEGLGAVNDHDDHVSIYPTKDMTFREYQQKLNSIPWEKGGGGS